MQMRFVSGLRVTALCGVLLWAAQNAPSAPFVINTNLQMRLVMHTTNSSGASSIRIVKDPRNDQLYYLKENGDIYRVNLMPGSGASTSVKVFAAADHTISGASGMAIGPDGTIYLAGNTTTNSGNQTFATIVKGATNGSGQRIWSVLARTQPYPRSRTAFDHVFNG